MAQVIPFPLRNRPGLNLREWIEKAGRQWCGFAHTDISWPMRGRYRCYRCQRTYAVPWEPRAQVVFPKTSDAMDDRNTAA